MVEWIEHWPCIPRVSRGVHLHKFFEISSLTYWKGSKNLVRKRQKNQFVELDFSNKRFQKSSEDGKGEWINGWKKLLIRTKVLKYVSQEKVSFWCRCSIFLSLTFVEIRKSFKKMLLSFNFKNFRIFFFLEENR